MSIDEESGKLPENEEVVAKPQADTASEVYAPYPMTEDTSMPEENPAAEAKPKKPMIIALCCAALVVVLGVLAAVVLPGLLNNGFYAQIQRISQKMKTVKSFAFDMDVTVNMRSGEENPISMSGKLATDEDGKVRTVYMEYGYSNDVGEIYLEITEDKLTYYIYDSDFRQWIEQSVDISMSGDAQGIDWKSLLQQAGMEEYINIEGFSELSQLLEDKIKDEQYLEDVWGYTRSKEGNNTVYAFTPVLEKATSELMKDIQLILTDEAKEEIVISSEEELAQELRGIACKMEITADAQDYLKSLLLSVELDEELSNELSCLSYKIELSDYNGLPVEIPEEVRQNAINIK